VVVTVTSQGPLSVTGALSFGVCVEGVDDVSSLAQKEKSAVIVRRANEKRIFLMDDEKLMGEKNWVNQVIGEDCAIVKAKMIGSAPFEKLRFANFF